MENKATMTNSTFQTTIEDTTYNGWENYETWNVALWIGNDEGLYNLARRSYSYQDLLCFVIFACFGLIHTQLFIFSLHCSLSRSTT